MAIYPKRNGKAEQDFVDNIDPVTGITPFHTSESTVPAIKARQSDIPSAKAAGVHINMDDYNIVWTREQSRLIEFLAQHCTLNKVGDTAVNKTSAQFATLHILTLRKFAHAVGITQKEFLVLRRFRPFWEAINERKIEILGIERFHQVADAIFEAAMNGSHADRKLFLDTFVTPFRKFHESEDKPDSVEYLIAQQQRRVKRLEDSRLKKAKPVKKEPEDDDEEFV